jgi:CO/xanthine dehydrogenase Mo-binding subunit
LPGGVHLVEVTEACAKKAGWQQAEQGWQRPQLQGVHGIGIAVGYKNVGFSFGYQENCWVKIKLQGEEEIEKAVVYIGSSEVGQGTHTAIKQMAAEALDLPLERAKLVASDTVTSPGSSGSCSASRMTFMAGNAVRGAAKAALKKWRAGERPAVAEHTYLAPETTPFDLETGYGIPNFAYGYVAQAVEPVACAACRERQRRG